jgi:hypothetical protein
MKVFIFFCLISGISLAQDRYLALDKPSIGHKNRLRFNAGDELWVKLRGEKKRYSLLIERLTDTSLVMGAVDFPLARIKSVTVRRPGGLRQAAAYLLPVAGGIFFLADTFNKSNGDRPNVSNWGIRVGGGLAGTGLLLFLTRNRTYKINTYRSLKVLRKI